MERVMRNIALLLVAVAVMAAIPAVTAQEEHGDFSEALSIIGSQKGCDELTESEFELLGDYYMELMHPGEAHEAMDAMMGGEGSESLRVMHTRMGQNFYCGNSSGMGSGMMGGGMMGSYGMMGSSSMMGSGWSVWGVLYALLLVGLVVVVFLLAALLYKKIVQK